ncbi:FAD-binding oxidoreductase [Streptomyces naganishii]|uniref:Oxidoreductase n=1 Tax=Streptomyces naganishii JCM 4654 TaxID=1306179 RepID=A0A918Y471_9ACTN|nr:FAD-binding oxidoreductase [Streptomyces naganishii]GHD90139.1 oxidoreductase [Streptomyces naganishii JCM 4654]
MSDAGALLADAVGARHVLSGEAIAEEYGGDESLAVARRAPAYAVRPASAAEVADVLRIAGERRIPVTARGAGTGMSGACVPAPGGIVVSFERMNRVLQVDAVNHVAVVQPGVSLEALDRAVAPAGLCYPVRLGEPSASVGGTIATNAGGMHAVRHGVTRHHVLGLEAVLASGAIVRSGGKYVKTSAGYDLTQLLVGSEGTLALVTEATLRLRPRAGRSATVLAAFGSEEDVFRAVPPLAGGGPEPGGGPAPSGGPEPVALEYVDLLAMAAIAADGPEGTSGLGIPEDVRRAALGYLLVVLEDRSASRLEEDVESVATRLLGLGALDVFVLPAGAARKLTEARERAFWTAKAAGADDVVDAVVPRGALPELLAAARAAAEDTGSLVTGCGHAGDGNVHLSVFQPDPVRRDEVLRRLFRAAGEHGGAVSGEHGVGRAKKPYFLELEDPAKVELMRGIKLAFDPRGILNPGVLLDPGPQASTSVGSAPLVSPVTEVT